MFPKIYYTKSPLVPVRKVYLAFPFIFLLLLLSVLGTGLQLAPQTVSNNLAIEEVAEYKGNFIDSIVSDQGELGLLAHSQTGEGWSIQLFDQNFEKTLQYSVIEYNYPIYLDQERLISVSRSFQIIGSNLTKTFTYINRSLGLSNEISVDFNLGISDQENDPGYFDLFNKKSAIIQNRLYVPYGYTIITDKSEYTLWGIMELDLQNLQTQQWVLGNSSAPYNEFYLHTSGQQLEINKIHAQVTGPETATVIVTTYQFDRTSGQLDEGTQKEYTCQAFCEPMILDTGEFILVRYTEDNGRNEFEIMRSNDNQNLSVAADPPLELSDPIPVDQNYLLINVYNQSRTLATPLVSWFYLLDLETSQLFKLPTNPDDLEDWHNVIIDDLVSGSLINIVYDEEDQVSYFYRYNLQLKQVINTAKQLGWVLPVGSLLLASGLGWMVIRVLRNQGSEGQGDLYPEVENQTAQE